MSSVVGSVVDMKVVMEHEADGDMGYAWLKTNSAGSGAYTLKPGRPMKVSCLKPIPNYRGGAAKPEARRYPPCAGTSGPAPALEKGDVDIARDLTPHQIAGMPATRIMCHVPQASLYYIGLNLKTPQFQRSQGAPGNALSRRL